MSWALLIQLHGNEILYHIIEGKSNYFSESRVKINIICINVN